MSNDQNFDPPSDRIEALWPTLSKMSPDQLREHIRKIRADRRVRKTTVKAKKAKISKTENVNAKIKKLIGSDEALLKKILGELGHGSGDKT